MQYQLFLDLQTIRSEIAVRHVWRFGWLGIDLLHQHAKDSGD